MYQKIGLDIFVIIGLALAQSAFVSGLPSYLSAIDLGVLSIIVLLSFGSYRRLLFWAIGLGCLLDSFTFYPFGTNIISLFFTAIISYLIFTYVLTNRSLYSILALTALAFCTKEIIFYLYLYTFSSLLGGDSGLTIFNISFFQYQFYGLLCNLIIMIIVFNIINFFSHRLKPVFVSRDKR